MADGDRFDCFLSHNSKDKPAVRALAADLRAAGVSVWLDEEQLRPGIPWQPLLESGIRASRSVAVMVGAAGIGPWQDQEQQAALMLAVRNELPVIPVLLPDARSQPDLPLFLANRTWVDLRSGTAVGADPDLDALVWGITGRRPTDPRPATHTDRARGDPPPPPPDPVDRRVSELHRLLIQAGSWDDLRRLHNQVKSLAGAHPLRPEVMDLNDAVLRALEAEGARRPPRRAPAVSYAWSALAGTLSIALLALGVWRWTRPPVTVPELVNRPTPEWIAEWTGAIAGLGEASGDPTGLRIGIGADRTTLEVSRRGRPTCTAPASVEVEEGYALVRTEGPIPCPDGTRLAEIALSCAEGSDGNADCSGRYDIDRPIRVALVRHGGGAWPVRPAPKPVHPRDDAGAAAQPPAPPAASPVSGGAPVAPSTTTPGPSGGPAPEAQGAPRPFSDGMTIGGQGPDMIALPAGCFLMGSPPQEVGRDDDEGLQHRVCLGSFSIGRTEVTFAQYDRFAEATGRRKPGDEGWGRGDRPVINVNWQDASDYADWLSAQTGRRYRLPSEAEWEYAARAGTQGPFWTGNCIRTDQANYNGRAGYGGCYEGPPGVNRRHTVPVASLPANPWGLYEVAGNVREGTQDCWHPDYEGALADGGAWLDGAKADCARRVVRGGSWFYAPRWLNSASRYWFTRVVATFAVGFRLARTP